MKNRPIIEDGGGSTKTSTAHRYAVGVISLAAVSGNSIPIG